MKKIILSILVMCFAAGFWGVNSYAADEHQAIADFMRADDFYKQAEYSEAIVSYEKALEEGFESGELYYNLGNAYYRDGQVGRAILNYERAQQLIPRDRDLRFNHRYVTSRYPDLTPDQPKNFIEKAFDRNIKFYTRDEIAMILFVLFIVLGLLWLAAFRWQWQRSTVIAVLLLTVSIMSLYAVGFLFEIADVRDKAVAVQKIAANFEPRAEATEHFQLPEGAVIKILKQEDGWSKIQRQDKKMGWVPSKSVERIEK